jgi:hypothetical protein
MGKTASTRWIPFSSLMAIRPIRPHRERQLVRFDLGSDLDIMEGNLWGAFVGWNEAWVEGDLDLGLVAAAGRKTRGAARVSLYKKGIEGDLFWQASHN